LETTRSIREDYLQQDAFRQEDAYAPLAKQARILKIIILYYHKCTDALKSGADFNKLIALSVKDDIAHAKEVPIDIIDKIFDEMEEKLNNQINSIINKEGE
jgi:V/A-type H+-transporting ATPase subunit A